MLVFIIGGLISQCRNNKDELYFYFIDLTFLFFLCEFLSLFYWNGIIFFSLLNAEKALHDLWSSLKNTGFVWNSCCLSFPITLMVFLYSGTLRNPGIILAFHTSLPQCCIKEQKSQRWKFLLSIIRCLCSVSRTLSLPCWSFLYSRVT